MRRIKLAICDDHPVFVNGLVSVLSKVPEIEIVGTGNRAATIKQLQERNPFEVILLDIEMPDVNGVELTAWLREYYPDVAVIALTMFDSAEKIREMVQAGAAGYLIKTTSTDEIVQAIHAVYTGNKHFKGAVLEKVVAISREKSKPDPIDLLTRREHEILRRIASEESVSEISASLFISVHTVNSHKKNILRKLNLRNTAGLVGFAYKNQLV